MTPSVLAADYADYADYADFLFLNNNQRKSAKSA
jgi:hypothetical protein